MCIRTLFTLIPVRFTSGRCCPSRFFAFSFLCQFFVLQRRSAHNGEFRRVPENDNHGDFFPAEPRPAITLQTPTGWEDVAVRRRTTRHSHKNHPHFRKVFYLERSPVAGRGTGAAHYGCDRVLPVTFGSAQPRAPRLLEKWHQNRDFFVRPMRLLRKPTALPGVTLMGATRCDSRINPRPPLPRA